MALRSISIRNSGPGQSLFLGRNKSLSYFERSLSDVSAFSSVESNVLDTEVTFCLSFLNSCKTIFLGKVITPLNVLVLNINR